MLMEGIHHVTAITGDAQRNLDFYTRVIGLRLVAKTVNQDDPNVYHLFYGEEQGRPGADLTFFEYPNAVPGRAGAGNVHRIVWRVASSEAIEFWAERLTAEGIEIDRDETSIRFADFEGLGLELVISAVADAPRIAYHPEIPAELAIQGFDGVRVYSGNPVGTSAILERVMGATRIDERTFDVRGEQRGGWIALDEPPALPGRQSAGTVHHVAWGIDDGAEQAWLDELAGAGVPNSGVDRPQLLPLDLLPRAGRRPVRARDRGPRLHRRRSRRGARHADDPPSVARAAARADRGEPDAARRPASELARAGREAVVASLRRGRRAPARRTRPRACRCGGSRGEGAARRARSRSARGSPGRAPVDHRPR